MHERIRVGVTLTQSHTGVGATLSQNRVGNTYMFHERGLVVRSCVELSPFIEYDEHDQCPKFLPTMDYLRGHNLYIAVTMRYPSACIRCGDNTVLEEWSALTRTQHRLCYAHRRSNTHNFTNLSTLHVGTHIISARAISSLRVEQVYMLMQDFNRSNTWCRVCLVFEKIEGISTCEYCERYRRIVVHRYWLTQQFMMSDLVVATHQLYLAVLPGTSMTLTRSDAGTSIAIFDSSSVEYIHGSVTEYTSRNHQAV